MTICNILTLKYLTLKILLYVLLSCVLTLLHMIPTMFKPEKSIIILEVTVHFFWLPVAHFADFRGKTSQRVRKGVSTCD